MFKKEIRKKGTERNNKKSSFIDVSNMQISTPFFTLFLYLSPFVCLDVKAKDVCDLVTIGLFVFDNIFLFLFMTYCHSKILMLTRQISCSVQIASDHAALFVSKSEYSQILKRLYTS